MVARRLAAMLAALALVAGCEFGEVTVARPEAQLVVHSVLNAGASSQWVLVERMLTGTVTIDDSIPYSGTDPIRTGSGLPVSGAEVTVTGADGTVLRGVEQRPSGGGAGTGTGFYRLDLPAGTAIRPGVRYDLRVESPEGAVVTGSTVVPNARAAGQPRAVAFDRERDTLSLSWAAAPAARSYALRVDSPYGPFLLFVDSLSLRLPGTLRNFFAERLPRVFFPGFRQQATIAAVDTNYFDYYRSRNDPFTGAGIINRLQGGIGLFGSTVIVEVELLDVTAPLRFPVEGRYVHVRGPEMARDIRLWIETPAERDVPAGLSGNWRVATANSTDGVLGTLEGTRVRLALLQAQGSSDTVTVFTGDVVGDTLIGTYRNATAETRLVKVR